MELVQVDAAAADWDKNRPAVVEAEAPRFLLSRKATAAALVSDRRDEEAADEDDAPTDRNVAALKAVATRVAVSAKKAILASLWKCIVIRMLFQWNCNEYYDINAIYDSVNSPTHQKKNKAKMMSSSNKKIQLFAKQRRDVVGWRSIGGAGGVLVPAIFSVCKRGEKGEVRREGYIGLM